MRVVVMFAAVLCGLGGLAEASASIRRKEAEAGLLRILGLQKRPAPQASPPQIPPAMLNLYHRQSKMDVPALTHDSRATANTARSFTHMGTGVRSGRRRRENRYRLVFNVSIPASETITGAELRVNTGLGRVSVHDIVRPGLRGKSTPLLRLIDTRQNSVGSLDVLPAIQRWLQEPKENHGLLLETEGARTKVESAAEPPVLMVYSNDGRASGPSRKKRAAYSGKQKHRKEGRDHYCRRHSLFVDFADVGWNDWIVAPPGYQAYYCHGDCPFPLSDHMNSTNHAVVQNLVHTLNRGVPKACCVPTDLDSLSMLYLDESGKVILKTYQDMTVVGCGCR